MRVTCADWVTLITVSAIVLGVVIVVAAALVYRALDAAAERRHRELMDRLDSDTVSGITRLAAGVERGLERINAAQSRLSALDGCLGTRAPVRDGPEPSHG